MRNVLAFLAAATLTVVGVGWYLGWYRVSDAPADQGRRNINIEFNTTKIREDLSKGGQKVQQILDNKRKERAGDKAEGAQEAAGVYFRLLSLDAHGTPLDDVVEVAHR